jgi:CP family cyanate transporter-like MFS transporter
MRALLRDPLAWQVTGFMAAQSSLAFITFGWLPVILQDRGMPATEAGLVASLSIMTQTVTALSVPTLAARCRDQRLWAVGIMSVVAAGLACSILAPLQYSIWSGLLLGLGQGGSFGLALTLIVLRASDSSSAASLSGMVQSIGSVIASLGPFLAGMIRRPDGDWSGAVLPFVVIAALAALLGAKAGRPLSVGTARGM